jgi:hypothetical protein
MATFIGSTIILQKCRLDFGHFETRTGETLFTGTGTQAGIEIVGDVSGLLEGKFRVY